MKLYHFTCDHGRRGVGVRGVLLPNAHPMLPRPLVWLTDLYEPPSREALGLTSDTLDCDRLAYRYETVGALPPGTVRWLDSEERAAMAPDDRARLEGLDGAQPARWYIARHPVRARLARFSRRGRL